MAFWIVSSERKTWTKYLVQAETQAEAQSRDNEEYLGYVDGDDDRATVSGPFDSKEAALESDDSRTEGR